MRTLTVPDTSVVRVESVDDLVPAVSVYSVESDPMHVVSSARWACASLIASSHSTRPLYFAFVDADNDPYRFSYEDLDDLMDSDSYSAGEIAVSTTTLNLGRAALDETRGPLRPAEVVGLPDGTLSLLWQFDEGHLAIDIRDDRFGAALSRSGSTVILNGLASELIDYLRRFIVADYVLTRQATTSTITDRGPARNRWTAPITSLMGRFVGIA